MNPGKRRYFSPGMRLVLGLLFIPAYLFQQSLIIRIVQFAVVVILYTAEGRKFRILPGIFLSFGVTAAYLLQPAGRVMFRVGNFAVTSGSLTAGISRSLLLVGLIYISRLSVSSGIKFSGRAGELTGKVFYYFGRITDAPKKFRFRDIYRKGSSDRLVHYMDSLLAAAEGSPVSGDAVFSSEFSDPPLYLSILTGFFILSGYILLIPPEILMPFVLS